MRPQVGGSKEETEYSQKEEPAVPAQASSYSSFRVYRGWLAINTRRCFQCFRKSSWLPTGPIKLILIEEGSVFKIGAINQCLLQLSAQ